MKINDIKITDNQMLSMGLPNYLMGNEIDNQMNKLDTVYLNLDNINKNTEK